MNDYAESSMGKRALEALLVLLHIRRPDLHVLDGAILLVSLAIVWLGVALGR